MSDLPGCKILRHVCIGKVEGLKETTNPEWPQNFESDERTSLVDMRALAQFLDRGGPTRIQKGPLDIAVLDIDVFDHEEE